MSSKICGSLVLVVVLCWPVVASAQKPAAVFEEFVGLFRDNYAFFPLRGVDWEEEARNYRLKLTASTSNDELFGILCQMIDPLNDGHVFISQGRKGCRSGKNQPWEAKSRDIEDFIYRKYLKSGPKKTGAITYGAIDETTGYIDIHHMQGCKSWLGQPRRTAKEMDEALATMRGVRKIIIDVRFNGGGNDECALGFASRFADKRRFVYSKETYYKGSYGSHRDLYISPDGTVNTTAKIVVLTSRRTSSAAEMFVMAMIVLPQVTIVGDSTRGIHSDIYMKKLSNGWQVGLSNQKYMLPDGRVYEKAGLPPHKLVSFRGDVLEKERDELIEQVLEFR